MKLKGNDFKYTFNGESKTADEIKDLIDDSTIAFVDGLTVNYFSPKKKVNEINDLVGAYDFKLPVMGTIYDTNNKEDLKILEFLGFSAQKKTKTEELLDEVEKHQEQNGGRVENIEFPSNPISTVVKILYPKEESIYSKLGDLKIDEVIKEEIAEKEKIQKLSSIGIAYDRKSLICDEKENKAYFDNLNGKKETDGKLDYSEINFKLLDLMSKRFMDNKVKYPRGNSKKALNKDEILWAAFRHLRKMIQPIENDPETYVDHLSAVATNLSIILDQLDLENSK